MLRSASPAVKAAARPYRCEALPSTRLLSSTTLRLRSDDGHAARKTKSSSSPDADRSIAGTAIPSSSSKPSTSSSTSKPVQISYNPPTKSNAGGGSITLNLPPQLVQAMSRKNPVTPTKTSSARAKAQASKALRQTLPEPTTGEVYAWATAYSYSFSELIRSGRLPANYQVFEDNEVIHIPQWPISSSAGASGSSRGEVFIFRSGSYVTWGLDEEQSRRFLRNVIQGRDLKYQVEVGRYSQIGDEAMDYLYAPSQLTRVQGDIIVIGQPPRSLDAEAEAASDEGEDGEVSFDASTSSSSDKPSSTAPSSTNEATPYTTFGTEWTPTLARLAFSQGLARSARLSVQETLLSTFLTSMSPIPALLSSTGSVPISRTSVIKHTGTLLRLRQTANLDRDNFYDEPEVYWENAKMEDHYRSICGNLDIGQRFETLNEKLDHCENLLGVVRALLTEKTTHRMELIIIGLIAFEAGMALVGHGWVPTPENVRGWWRDVKGYFGGEVKKLDGAVQEEAVTAETLASSPSTLQARLV